MRRRDFTKGIAVSVAIWPCAARAQRAGEPVIGFLSARSAKESEHLVDAFRKGMAEQGIVEGQNAAVDYRWADSRYERLAGQAADLLSRQPKVLVSVGGDMTAKVATAATRTTPIVAVFIGDPVAGGFVTSLSRPGGNITGVSNSNAVIEAKRLGLLREVKPGIETVGVLLNPSSATAPSQQKESRKRCERSGSKCSFSKPATTQNLRPLLDSSLIIGYPRCSCRPMHFLRPPGDKLAELAARTGVPAIYSLREAVIAGGLMSYGNNLPDTYRLIGTYAARIVKGAKAADLPVLQPTRFES